MANAAYGFLLKRGDGGSPESFTTVAEVVNVPGLPISLDTEDTTSHDSGGWKDFTPKLLEAGEFQIEVNLDLGDATHDYSTGLLYALVNRSLDNYQMVHPDTGSTEWEFSAYCVDYAPEHNVDGIQRATFTFRPSGEPTLA